MEIIKNAKSVLLGGMFTFGAFTHLIGQEKNILFIAVDDLKPLLNCYGESDAITPNIDLLASKSSVFTNAHTQWAVSGPSRASLLTGKTPDITGVRNLTTQMRDILPNVITLPQFFKNKNYTTVGMGKIFDPRNSDEGHDAISWSIPYTDPSQYTYPAKYGSFVGGTNYRVTNNTASEQGPDGVDFDGYTDGQICLDALSKLDQFAQNSKPFFLAVGFKKPHIPFVAPKKYWDLYQRENLDIAEFQEMAAGSPAYAYFKPEPNSDSYVDIPAYYSEANWQNQTLEEAKQKELLHGYYASVSYIDDMIGKLMAKLTEKGLANNTIIVLFGDHGYHLGDHNQWGKHTNYEQSTRVPLIIYMPNQTANVYTKPVDLLDIYPTLVDLTQNEIPQDLQGKSLKPVLENNLSEVKSVAVTEYRAGGHAGYSFRNEQYRYSIWLETGNDRPDLIDWNASKIVDEELYDYTNDPLETENLISKANYITIKNLMKLNAQNWWNEQRNYLQTLSIKPNTIEEKTVKVISMPTVDSMRIEGVEIQSIRIVSVKGELIRTEKITNNQFTTQGLNSGIYILRMKDANNQVYKEKIYIE